MSYPHQHQGHWLAVVRGRCFLSWGIDRAKDISKVLKVGKKNLTDDFTHTHTTYPGYLLYSCGQKFRSLHTCMSMNIVVNLSF